jgi:uncharacterized protein YaeQ
VARHPSESGEYLITRILAYCLEFSDGIQFSKGLSDPEEPTIAVRDLTGAIRTWIEIGSPDAARVHKASKAAERVAIYTHRDPAPMLRLWANERIHRVDAVELYRVDTGMLDAMVAVLERRMAFSLSVNDRDLYLSVGQQTIEGRAGRVFVSR